MHLPQEIELFSLSDDIKVAVDEQGQLDVSKAEVRQKRRGRMNRTHRTHHTCLLTISLRRPLWQARWSELYGHAFRRPDSLAPAANPLSSADDAPRHANGSSVFASTARLLVAASASVTGRTSALVRSSFLDRRTSRASTLELSGEQAQGWHKAWSLKVPSLKHDERNFEDVRSSPDANASP